MLHKLVIPFCLFVFATANSYGQDKSTALVKGRLKNKVTLAGFNDLKVTLPSINAFSISDGNGNFSIGDVPFGEYTVIISGDAAENDTTTVEVNSDVVDMGSILVTPRENSDVSNAENIPTIVIDNDINDNDAAPAMGGASSTYSGGQDQFLFTSGFTLGRYFFRPRGLNNMELQVNGIPVEDLQRDVAAFGKMGGLNNILHDRNNTYGLSPSGYGYGNTNGMNYIDATAANQYKGTNITYINTNRNYRNKVMITHGSGVDKKGWAYAMSAARTWAKEGYVKGTFYDGYSVYAGVSKIAEKHQFNLSAFAAPTTRGNAVFGAIDEAYQLANDNQYNSGWGYQQGKKRSAKEVNVFQPIIIANHTWRPSDNTRWNTALGYEFGNYSSSTLDFYNAYNPDPDYYRNLPSYYLNFSDPQPEAANALRNRILADPNILQINWDNLYASNYTNIETVKNANGIAGTDVTGRRSMYAVSNRVDDMKKISFNTNIEHSFNEHLDVYGGVKIVSQNDRFYKEMVDLLGGDFYLNYNQFATQQAVQNPSSNQNDVNNPNAIIKVGDKYSYDYSIDIKQTETWAQATMAFNKIDFFVAANGGYTSFQREGFMKNGLYPDNSYGKSTPQDFLTYRTKGGVTYKINPRNSVYANADFTADAPKASNTYISARNRDYTITNPVTQKMKTLECGYLLKSPVLYARITGYVTDINDAIINKMFFNDDPTVVSFVNYIMSGVSMRSIGGEFSGNLKLTDELSVSGIASIGQYYYTNRPYVTFYQDNRPDIGAVERKVYIKDYYVSAGPQSVYSCGFNYRSAKYWNARINFNYTDRNYVDINPERHTQLAADLVDRNSDKWNSIYTQEKLPAAFTIDVSGGKSFRVDKWIRKIDKQTLLLVNVGITNLLNKTDIKVAGYEQLRYDYTQRSPNKFPNMYHYAFGINYYASISLRF